jgi:curli biogenesis system outer membrane secretion channel CsgG
MKLQRTLSAAIFLLSIALPSATAQSTTPASANQTATVNECTSRMSECDSKIEQGLAFAVRNKAKGCLFERAWRPTNVSGHQTGHLSEIRSSVNVIGIGEKHFTL